MMDKSLSRTFTFLRYPLALLVIYLHIMPPVSAVEFSAALSRGLSGDTLYCLVQTVVRCVAECAVPCYFFMSGYLLFVKQERITFRWYWSLLKRKTRRLLIPYIVWNVMAVMYYYMAFGDLPSSVLSPFVGWPLNYPLWFLRYLFAMMVVSPCCYVVARCGGVWGLIVATGVFVVRYADGFSFIDLSGYFFFVGCWCGTNQWTIRSSRLLKMAWTMSAVVLLTLEVCSLIVPSAGMGYIHAAFLIFGVGLVLLVADYMTNRLGLEIPVLLSGASFFIYLSHKLGPTFVSKFVFGWLPSSGYYRLLMFLVCPVIASLICVAVYRLCSRYIPKFLYVSTGSSQT